MPEEDHAAEHFGAEQKRRDRARAVDEGRPDLQELEGRGIAEAGRGRALVARERELELRPGPSGILVGVEEGVGGWREVFGDGYLLEAVFYVGGDDVVEGALGVVAVIAAMSTVIGNE